MPTFVLVHGGGCTSESWQHLVPHLDDDVILVDLPGRGRRPGGLAESTLADCVAATVEDIGDATDVTLVGHSIGGFTVAHVLNQIPEQIKHTVLLSSTVPPHGSAVVDHIDPEVRDAVLAGSGDGTYKLPEDELRKILCTDLDAEQCDWVVAGFVDETTSTLAAKADLSGLHAHPSVTYITTTLDETLPPEQQQAQIANAGDPTVIELEAGHMSMVSKPEDLAAILNSIAAS